MPTDEDIILATIAQQYRIAKNKLYGMKLIKVVRAEVHRLDSLHPGGWKAADFNWDLVLTPDDKMRPELLKPE